MNPEFTWQLEDMVSGSDEWNLLYDSIEKQIGSITEYAGKIMSSSQNLFNCLDEKDKLYINLNKLYVFSNMNLHQDTSDTDAQVLVQRVSALSVRASSALAFVEPEIMDADESTIRHYIEENDALKLYEHYFDDMLRQKAHILPKEQEELLALASDFASTPNDIFSMFMNADLVFPEVIDDEHNPIRLTHGNYLKLIKSLMLKYEKRPLKRCWERWKKARTP